MNDFLSREHIQLMRQAQRLIKQEFGVHIRLDDATLVGQAQRYAQNSRSETLKKSVEQLAAYLDAEDEKGGSSGHNANKRVYRGQIIEDAASDTAPRSNATGKTLIYRGQRLNT